MSIFSHRLSVAVIQMQLALVLVLVLVHRVSAITPSNYFVDTFTTDAGSAVIENKAYPTNLCVPVYIGFTPPTYPYLKYECSGDGSSVTALQYGSGDSTCSGVSVARSTAYTMASVTAGELFSFVCDATDNYMVTSIEFPSCGTAVATTKYAIGVCYLLADGSTYQSNDCSGTDTNIVDYADNNCQTQTGNPVVYGPTCTNFGGYYFKTVDCIQNNTDVIPATSPPTSAQPTAYPSSNPTSNPITSSPTEDGATPWPSMHPTSDPSGPPSSVPTYAPTFDLTNTNFFIDVFTNEEGGIDVIDNTAYPTDICVAQALTSLSPITYAVYECDASTGLTVTAKHYGSGDDSCSGGAPLSTIVYNGTGVSSAGDRYSFHCGGALNYLATDYMLDFLGTQGCAATVFARTYVAIGVCFSTANGALYKKYYCSGDVGYIREYNTNDNQCSESNRVSDVPFDNACALRISTPYAIYSKNALCLVNNSNVIPVTMSPTFVPTSNPTLASQLSSSPSMQPTKYPITASPTWNPVTYSPTGVTGSPTLYPTENPNADEASNRNHHFLVILVAHLLLAIVWALQ